MDAKRWAACQEPGSMLHSLRGKGSNRKLRLFAAACRGGSPAFCDRGDWLPRQVECRFCDRRARGYNLNTCS